MLVDYIREENACPYILLKLNEGYVSVQKGTVIYCNTWHCTGMQMVTFGMIE